MINDQPLGSDNLFCVCQSLYDSLGHLANTQMHRMTIENLILDGPVQILFSENKKYQTLLSEVKVFARQNDRTIVAKQALTALSILPRKRCGKVN